MNQLLLLYQLNCFFLFDPTLDYTIAVEPKRPSWEEGITP